MLQKQKKKKRNTAEADRSKRKPYGETVQQMAAVALQQLSKTEKARYTTTYKNELAEMGRKNPEASPSRVREKRSKRDACVRYSLSRVGDLVKALNDDKKQKIRKLGFGGVLFVDSISMPESIVKWVVDNFNHGLVN